MFPSLDRNEPLGGTNRRFMGGVSWVAFHGWRFMGGVSWCVLFFWRFMKRQKQDTGLARPPALAYP
jgi:hypothetical protein